MKIFGDHDEATIQQLKRCAAAERDAPAVLCADGHLGYSMPIGGVAQLMVEMDQTNEVQIAGRVETMENMQQRDRIRSARHRGHDARAGLGQAIVGNRAPNAIEHHH